MLMKQAHRISGLILILFTLVHLGVHLTALFGASAHLQSLDAVQWIYRNPIGEPLLLIAISIQVISGFARLHIKKFRRWAAWQTLSGVYLLVFLTVHTSATVFTHTFFGVETDFYWAAGSLAFSPIKYGFAIYYFAAILAFFVHIGAAIRFGFPIRSKRIPKAMPWLGGLVAIGILVAFSGYLYPITIPEDVAEYYAKYFGMFGVSP